MADRAAVSIDPAGADKSGHRARIDAQAAAAGVAVQEEFDGPLTALPSLQAVVTGHESPEEIDLRLGKPAAVQGSTSRNGAGQNPSAPVTLSASGLRPA